MKKDIKTLLDGYQAKTFSPKEVASKFLNDIDKKNKDINAYLEVNTSLVNKQIEKLEKLPVDLEKFPLYGVPIAIKDNILVDGWQATAGSKILEGYRAPYTATCVQRLSDAGAIIVGKTNCDEFAMGSSNETSFYGPTRNPWDVARVPGGSSGGSAAAVATSLALGALGTDTGGSIRQPASLCGIVGMKPTYGLVSRFGVIAYASSLDQVGPFGINTWDNARILEVMAGHDPRDATSSTLPVPKYTKEMDPKKPFTVGVASDWLVGLDDEVKDSFEKSLQLLKENGVQIVEVQLPHAKHALSVYYLIAPSEASSNLARYDGVHYGHRSKEFEQLEELYKRSRGEGFGKEVKLRIMLDTYALSAGYYDAYYIKANQVRKLIENDFEEAFSVCDTIAVPTSPTTAFKLGDKTEDPIKMYLSDIFTLPINLAGLPGISVPCGQDKAGLPIGLQFIGNNSFSQTHSLQTPDNEALLLLELLVPQLVD